MKIILKRIIGFIEFALGLIVVEIMVFGFISGLISGELFTKFTWKSLVQIPFALLIYPSFIKYGWYWMFNIVDITDVKALNRNDEYFQSARQKAHSEIEIFLAYLRQDEFYCSVLIPKDINKLKSKLHWQIVKYINSKQLYLIEDDIKKSIIEIEIIDDWMVNKDNLIIGNYTLKALAEKSTQNGEVLSRKSKKILEKFVT